MDVKGIERERLMKQEQPPLVLKEAQIVQGKITKIFNGQKAQIQIGSHTLLAEVSAPLTVGERYFFQVVGTDERIHLKVIGESLKPGTDQSVEMLMEKLGIRQTKISMDFIKKLTQEKIPFHQQQLIQAIGLLDQTATKQQLMPVLVEMMQQKLPITQATVQAFEINKGAQAGDLIEQLRFALQRQSDPSQVEKALLKKLDALGANPDVKGSAMLECLQNRFSSEVLLPLLKWSGHVQPELTDKELLPFTKNKLPIPAFVWTNKIEHLDVYQLKQMFNYLANQEQNLRPQALRLSTIFHGAANGMLSEEQMTKLQQAISRDILPFLPTEMRPLLQQMLATGNQAPLHEMLTLFARKTVYTQVTATLLPALEMITKSGEMGPLSDLFHSHIQRFLQTSGFGDEYQLRHHFQETAAQITQDRQSAQSIKMMLQQLVSQENGINREAAQPLLQLITGMQMQMMVETNNVLQATIPIPGNKFALPKDMLLQFEGQKTSDGKISPDYCRILFVLELQHIQETMIDMHVQKRVISVTIYNDVIQPGSMQDQALEAVLQANLNGLDYQLSSITWKAMEEKSTIEPTGEKGYEAWHKQLERFDYRI